MEKNKEIRKLVSSEIDDAMGLVWEVFSECNACDCTEEGIDEFWRTIDLEYIIHRFGDGHIALWGAFDDGFLVGVCGMLEHGRISLLFVDIEYQGQGVGKNLLKKAIIDCKAADDTLDKVVVNSTSFAKGFFKDMGFEEAGEEQTQAGITSTPMELRGK